MNTKDLSNCIKKLDATLANMEYRLSARIEKQDEAHLFIKDGRYFARKPGQTNGIYLSKDKEKEIKALEQHDYDTKLLKAIKAERATLGKIKTQLSKTPDADDIYESIPEERRHLIQPYQAIDDNTLKEMQAQRRLKHSPRNTPYTTLNGEHVASKSELIIADRLKENGIPYIYEPVVSLDGNGGLDQYPDFIAWNRRTGAYLYWEHFGMMADPQYADTAIMKLNTYAEFGIYPGSGLLVTFEDKERPLSTQYVDGLIQRFLK